MPGMVRTTDGCGVVAVGCVNSCTVTSGRPAAKPAHWLRIQLAESSPVCVVW